MNNLVEQLKSKGNNVMRCSLTIYLKHQPDDRNKDAYFHSSNKKIEIRKNIITVDFFVNIKIHFRGTVK